MMPPKSHDDIDHAWTYSVSCMYNVLRVVTAAVRLLKTRIHGPTARRRLSQNVVTWSHGLCGRNNLICCISYELDTTIVDSCSRAYAEFSQFGRGTVGFTTTCLLFHHDDRGVELSNFGWGFVSYLCQGRGYVIAAVYLHVCWSVC